MDCNIYMLIEKQSSGKSMSQLFLFIFFFQHSIQVWKLLKTFEIRPIKNQIQAQNFYFSLQSVFYMMLPPSSKKATPETKPKNPENPHQINL